MIRSILAFTFLLSSPLVVYSNIEKATEVEQTQSSKKPLRFSMWKQKKIRAAHKKYQSLKDAYQKAEGSEKKLEHQKLQLAYKVLEYTRALKIEDYFEMYLADSFPNDINALQYAVEGMTKSQISDLLVAYQKRLRASKLRPYKN